MPKFTREKDRIQVPKHKFLKRKTPSPAVSPSRDKLLSVEKLKQRREKIALRTAMKDPNKTYIRLRDRKPLARSKELYELSHPLFAFDLTPGSPTFAPRETTVGEMNRTKAKHLIKIHDQKYLDPYATFNSSQVNPEMGKSFNKWLP